MMKKLKKQSLRTFLPWIITCAVAAIAFFAVSLGGVFQVISGAKPLNQLDVAASEGAYVSVEASDVIVAFANLTSQSDSGKITLKTFYLYKTAEDRYIGIMDSKERNANVLERAMDQSHAYYMDKSIDTLTKLGSINGTVKPLEEGMESYMTDCITNYGLPGCDSDNVGALILPYEVELDHVGFLSATLTFVLFGVGLVFLIVMLALLIPVLAGAYQKKAISQVAGDLGNAAVEPEYESAGQIESVRVGKYIWYQKGASTKVLKTANQIWGYVQPEPLVVSKYRWPVALYDMEQNLNQVRFMDKKQAEKFLDAIASQGHPFVKGYTTAYNQQFKTDLDEFLKEAEKNTANK